MSAPSLYLYLDVAIVRMQEWNATMIPVCIGDNDINMYMHTYIHAIMFHVALHDCPLEYFIIYTRSSFCYIT